MHVLPNMNMRLFAFTNLKLTCHTGHRHTHTLASNPFIWRGVFVLWRLCDMESGGPAHLSSSQLSRGSSSWATLDGGSGTSVDTSGPYNALQTYVIVARMSQKVMSPLKDGH